MSKTIINKHIIYQDPWPDALPVDPWQKMTPDPVWLATLLTLFMTDGVGGAMTREVRYPRQIMTPLSLHCIDCDEW